MCVWVSVREREIEGEKDICVCVCVREREFVDVLLLHFCLYLVRIENFPF